MEEPFGILLSAAIWAGLKLLQRRKKKLKVRKKGAPKLFCTTAGRMRVGNRTRRRKGKLRKIAKKIITGISPVREKLSR